MLQSCMGYVDRLTDLGLHVSGVLLTLDCRYIASSMHPLPLRSAALGTWPGGHDATTTSVVSMGFSRNPHILLKIG